MQLTELITCDICRDGGSYAATVGCEGGRWLSLDLEIADRDGPAPRYGALIEAYDDDPASRAPVALGSARERELVAALEDLLATLERRELSGRERHAAGRLREMLARIPGRSGEARHRPRHIENAAYSDGSLVVVAILTIVPGRLEAFRTFERRAAAILARHGAAIERAIYLPGVPTRELHVLRFPDEAAFAAYRADPALAALEPPRASVILATEILIGEDGPAYGRP